MKRGKSDQTKGFAPDDRGGANAGNGEAFAVPSSDAVTLGDLCGAVLVLADAVLDPSGRTPIDFVREGRVRL